MIVLPQMNLKKIVESGYPMLFGLRVGCNARYDVQPTTSQHHQAIST